METAVAACQLSSQVRGSQQEVRARMPLQNQRLVHNQQHHHDHHHLHTPPVTHHPSIHHLLLHSSHNPLSLLQKSGSSVGLNRSSLPSATPPSRRVPRWYGSSPLSCPTHSLSFTSPQPGSAVPHHFSQLALSNSC